jgi:hypothetical protein
VRRGFPAAEDDMKTKAFLLRFTLFSVALMMAASVARNEDTRNRDGNWWRNQTRVARLSYMTGFFDGVQLGNNFSYFAYAKEYEASDPDALVAMQKTTESFDKYSTEYLNNVTNEQVADGLDKFYSDYRNRSIALKNGVWIVLNAIAGKPESEIEHISENFRKYPQ